MNYTVAQDDLKDLNEELESVQNAVKQAKEAETQAVQALTEVRTLEAKAQEELQSSRASETQLQDELSAERTKLAAKEETITQCEARLAAIENDYNTAKQAALEETRDLVLAIAIYRKGIDSATEHGIASERSLQASIARVAQLEAEQAALLQQGSSINELREQVAESQEQLKAAELVAQELAAVKLERDVLDSRIAELETELSASNSARSEVETKAALLEKELIDANNSLASARAEHESAVAEHSRRMVEAENSSDARTAELNAQHEAALEEAERRLQDAKAQVETELAVISEQLKTTQEEVATLSKRVKDLSHSLDMTTAEREAAIVRAEELAQTAGLVDGLQAEVSRLESELSEMTMARNAHASRIDDLAAELSDAMADQAALNEELSSVSADNEALREKEAQLLEEMDAQVAALESEKVKVIESQAALAAAEKENRSSASRLRFMESQVKELTQRIADLRDDLDAVNSGSSTATRAAAEKDEEIARLKKERTSLKSEVEALNEDLQRAYASLTTKTNEIEDADDRQQELSKEISRQKKRVAKLERQNKSLLSELETTRNTLDNVSPARTSVSHIAPLSSTFELSATAAGTPKHKRTRDEEERSVPREVWVQGEPAPIGKPDKSPAISRSPLALRAAAGSNRPTVERPIAGLAKKKTSSFSVAARLAVLERRGGSGLADAR